MKWHETKLLVPPHFCLTSITLLTTNISCDPWSMPQRLHKKLHLGLRFFLFRIFELMRQPIFIVITLLGNSCILAGTLIMFHFEKGVNPKMHTMLDAVWWAIATVSTVGYGDISPITIPGKVVGIAMMLVGTALFSTYTALFAGALVTVGMHDLGKDIRDIETSVLHIERGLTNLSDDELSVHRAILKVESALQELHEIKEKKKI